MKWLIMTLAFVPALSQLRHSGAFQNKKETLRGSYSIVHEGGQTLLRLSADFATKAGLDLQIVFSPQSFDAVTSKNALTLGAVSIGLPADNKGAQEFVIPEDLDLAHMRCLSIHCAKHTRLWGGAPL